MSTREQHLQDWNDVLQDWLDGELGPADRARFESHLAGCAICQECVGAFERLDAEMASALPPLTVSAAFDRHLLARIEANDEQIRVTKRREIEREMQAVRRELARGWRRTLAILVPSMIAGIAVAFVLTATFAGSDAMRSIFADWSAVLGRDWGRLLPFAFTSFLSAGIGVLIARWVALTSE